MSEMTPQEALETYGNELTPYEKSELAKYSTIYTIGTVRVVNERAKVDS